ASRPLRSRIMAVKGRLLALTAPLDLNAGTIRWPETGRRVLLDFRPGSTDGPDASTPATVLERRMNPFPYLLLQAEHDVPVAIAAATERWGQILVVTGGKGGTGKSVTAVNVASGAAAAGIRTVLVDGDFATGNISVLSGVRPTVAWRDVLYGRAPLERALVSRRQDLWILASPVDQEPHTGLSSWELARVAGLLDHLSQRFELVVVDTAAGVDRSITGLLTVADHAWIVTLHETPALLDAYRLLKAAVLEGARTHYHLIVNRVEAWREAQAAGRRFVAVAAQHLRVSVRLAGLVPEDRGLRAWAAALRPGAIEPGSTSAGRALRAIAARHFHACGLVPDRRAARPPVLVQ
ncbi:MAG TPA: P-loop NTPase, partial [Bacillota bacterium]